MSISLEYGSAHVDNIFLIYIALPHVLSLMIKVIWNGGEKKVLRRAKRNKTDAYMKTVSERLWGNAEEVAYIFFNIWQIVVGHHLVQRMAGAALI